jgi:CRISPR system Cascade subunit CasD
MKSSTLSFRDGRKGIVLRLAGPYQSWGLPSCHDNRLTSDFATKSGIVGIIGNALGMPRDDEETIAKLASLSLAVFRLKPGTLSTDFQIVGAKWEGAAFRLTNASGETRKENEPAITNRQYLVGADFLAVLEGPSIVIDQCVQALLCPKYTLFLGRKNCIPSEMILAGVCDSESEVLAHLKTPKSIGSDHAGLKGVEDGTEYVKDVDFEKGEMATDYPMDYPVRFGFPGVFRRRPVLRGIWKEQEE